MPPSDTFIRLRTLGSLSAQNSEGRAVGGLTGLPALLFVYLLDRGTLQPRSELTALFWPGAEASKGRHGLRQALSRIRSAVGSAAVVGTDPVGIDGARVNYDVWDFERALDAGDLEGACGLWKGPFLNGAADGVGWELGEWIDLRRRELEAVLLDHGRGRVRSRMAADDFDGALQLVGLLQECVPGSRGLAMDLAELLVEVGRPHEAEVQLKRADVDASDPRAAGILKRAAKTRPEEAAVTVPAEVGAETAQRGPRGVATVPEANPGVWGRRRRTTALVAAGVAVAAALYGFLGPVPVGEAAIYFCAHRETGYGFVLDLPERAIQGVLTEPACPIIPLSEGALLVMKTSPETGTNVFLLLDGEEAQLFAGDGARFGLSGPLRQAGLRDGVLSPDGRWLVGSMEQLSRPRPQNPALMNLVDEGPLPGVAGLRRDPPYDWDVVMIDLTTGETRSIGRADALTWDPRFTPDGEAVVYVSDETGGGDLYRFDLASGTTTRLTDDPRMARVPAVGRRWTAFMLGSATEGDPEQVAVLEHASGKVRVLHPGPWNQGGLDLSPDERRVCWTSKELGHWESDIVVADADGGGHPRVLRAPGRDDNCQWLGSKHVLFRSWRGGDGQLFLQGLRPWSQAEDLTHWDGDVLEPFLKGG